MFFLDDEPSMQELLLTGGIFILALAALCELRRRVFPLLRGVCKSKRKE
jgi:hypothetical protein